MKFHTLRFIPASNRYIIRPNMAGKHTSHLPAEEILVAFVKSRILEETDSKLA